MDKQKMEAIMSHRKGIGVITTRVLKCGRISEICYFYENFDGRELGITRAMDQLYPLMNKGIIKTITFVKFAKYESRAGIYPVSDCGKVTQHFLSPG